MSAGWSADEWADALAAQGRGWRAALRTVFRPSRAAAERQERDAAVTRRRAGAEGERRTAALLEPLGHEGWRGLYDRALPGGGRANADHVLIPPCGTFAVNCDSKLCSARYRVHAQGGQLLHGTAHRTRALSSILYESRAIAAALRVPVLPVMAVHNAPVAGGGFTVQGVTVLPADRLIPYLRGLTGPPNPVRALRLAEAAAAALPRYQEKHR